jgi:hypothetical protein
MRYGHDLDTCLDSAVEHACEHTMAGAQIPVTHRRERRRHQQRLSWDSC